MTAATTHRQERRRDEERPPADAEQVLAPGDVEGVREEAAHRSSSPRRPDRGEVLFLLVHGPPADVLDEDLLEAGIGDLEARDAVAAIERGAQDRGRDRDRPGTWSST